MDSLKNSQKDIFNIEDAKPEDVETMIAIRKARWLEIYPNEKYGITTEDIVNIDWTNKEDLVRRRKELIQDLDNVHTFVLKNEKREIVGFCKVSKVNNSGEINAIYTLPGFDSKGLGRQLIEEAFKWIGPNLDIKLKVVSYNSNAIGFYKKFGFKETNNKVDYGGTQLPSAKEIPRIEMVRLHQNI